MPETEQTYVHRQHWDLTHPDGRTITITHKTHAIDGHDDVEWVELNADRRQARKGAVSIGILSAWSAGDEAAALLTRFDAEGFGPRNAPVPAPGLAAALDQIQGASA